MLILFTAMKYPFKKYLICAKNQVYKGEKGLKGSKEIKGMLRNKLGTALNFAHKVWKQLLTF